MEECGVQWVSDKPKPKPQKFPFKAKINGREVIVWDDWVEYPDE